jgi:hypothetical protein
MGLPNTSNVKSGDFPKIKADWYGMRFVDFETKTDKNGDNYTEIELNFADSDRPAWANLSHNEDFLWKAKQFKEAIGMADSESDLTPYKGALLMVFVKNREFEGSNYPDPRKFKPMPGAEPTPTPEPPTQDDADLPF